LHRAKIESTSMHAMNLPRSRTRNGFTLVELMIVVAIIGILAGIAIPAFSRYVKKARTAEAVGHLSKQWAGSLTYYVTDHVAPGGAMLPKEFPGPSGAWTSNVSECACLTGQRCVGNSPVWASDGVWLALMFSVPDPHQYMPGYSGSGSGTSAQFTAYAKGDLDCDGTLAEFIRAGRVSSLGDPIGHFQPYIVNELE
jgi:prepilin-type N-terminal cleavage/methylation domain-containing protein